LTTCGFCFDNSESGVASLSDELIRYAADAAYAAEKGRACAAKAADHRFDWDAEVVSIIGG
jgi:hypothetical protein